MNASIEERLQAILDRAVQHDEYWEEKAVLRFTESVVEQLQRQRLTQSDLAKRIGCSNAHVSKILSGTENLTLKTMDKIARALDCSFDPTLEPKGKQTTNKDSSVQTDKIVFDVGDLFRPKDKGWPRLNQQEQAPSVVTIHGLTSVPSEHPMGGSEENAVESFAA